MARKKDEKPPVPAVADDKVTSQARLELPTDEFERVRSAARKIGLSVSSFIRMAVLKETRRVEEGRDL